MAKQQKKPSRRQREQQDLTAAPTFERAKKSARLRATEAWERKETKPLTCKTDAQRDYLRSLIENPVTLGIGPAGTGKTYVSVKHAAQEMDAGRIERIIVVRPIIESGGGLGFLPGDEGEKTAPYKVPFLEVLEEHYGKSHLEAKMNCAHPKIVFVPPEFIRGRTFKDAYIILDEAQNMTVDQMETFLTRIGTDARCVIQGDPVQCDLRDKKGNRIKSGLTDAVEILAGMQEVGTVEFTVDDIVRSGFCKAVAIRYHMRRQMQAEQEVKA